MKGAPRILLSAGEASGDRLGAGLAAALLARRPGLRLYGMGGERMAAAGVEIVQDSAAVSVVGFVEVLAHLGEIRAAMARLEATLANEPPDLLVPVDFPDFNFRLAARARRRGVPVVYFVSPQIWAWRRGRVRTLRRLARRVLVLFPFEVPFYAEAGVPVTFVGHPAAEPAAAPAPERELRARAGLAPESTVIALLPGSRRSEVSRLLPILLEAARRLVAARPGLEFLVPAAPGLPREALAAPIAASGLAGVRVHDGDFPAILGVCRAGAVASGTASLEAALAGLPVVVVYRMGWLSYLVGRALVRVEHIALPNLVAGRRILPELVQRDCRPESLAAAIRLWLDDPDEERRVRLDLATVRERLGAPGVFDRAADAVLAELDASGARD